MSLTISVCTERQLCGEASGCSSLSPGHSRWQWVLRSTNTSLLSWYRICQQCRRPELDPWVRKIPWRRAWQPTQVFLPRESPWTEEAGRLPSMGSQRVEDDCVTSLSFSFQEQETVLRQDTLLLYNPSVQFISVAQSCPTLCNSMNRSTPGLPVHHQLPEFTQTRVH